MKVATAWDRVGPRAAAAARQGARASLAAAFACVAGPVIAQPTSFQFAPPIVRQLGSQHFPTHIAAADLNGDGKLDFVIPGRDTKGIVNYMLGNGDGTFGPLLEIVVDTQTDWAEIRDFTGDGKLDVALAIRSFNGRVAIVPGNGDGTFSKEATYYHVGRETRSLLSADLDGDGDFDIVASNYNSTDVVILRNSGSGIFTVEQRTVINEYVSGTVGPQQLSGGDFDKDGDFDIAITSIGSGRVSILNNGGSAVFSPEIAYAPPTQSGQQAAVTNSVVVDIDRDGDLDIISPLGYIAIQPRFAAFLNDGSGGFNTIQTFLANTSFSISWVPAAGDLDGDGDADLAFGYGLAGDLTFVRNDTPVGGPLAFGSPQFSNVGEFVRFVTLVDLDGDCDLDVALVEMGSHTLRVFRNLTPQQSGCSSGVASSEAAMPAGALGNPAPVGADAKAAAAKPGAVPTTDLNHDGRLNAADLASQLADRPGVSSPAAKGEKARGQ